MSSLSRLDALAPLPRLLAVVAGRRALDRVVSVALPCALVAGAASVLLARYAHHVPRAVALAAIVPAFVPLVLARRRIERDALPLALEVDHRLKADAAVVTAAELLLASRATAEGLPERIQSDARKALDGRGARDVFAPLGRRHHATLAGAVALVIAALVAPIRPARPTAPPRVVAKVKDAQTAEAARQVAESLEAAAREDPDHARPVEAVATAARQLARDLEHGMSRDEALARMDELERSADEALAWARDERHREAANAALAELDTPDQRELRDALAQGDMSRVDEAVRRVADQREAAARRAAEEALARAAEAARSHGSNDLARALDEERDLLRRRGASNDLAREVARALGNTPGAQRIAEHLSRASQSDRELSRALDEVMREMDRTLTPEERRRLAEAMARMATQADPGTRANFERAGRAMTPEEARAAMRALLEQLRNGSLDRTRAGGAARAGEGARGEMVRLRVGLQTGRTPGRGEGQGRNSANGTPGSTPGSGGHGSDHDEGHVPTAGSTRRANGQGFVAPVQASPDPTNPGLPVGSELVDTTGAQAVTATPERLQQIAPSALQGLERTPVPEPYRDQVRTYFGR